MRTRSDFRNLVGMVACVIVAALMIALSIEEPNLIQAQTYALYAIVALLMALVVRDWK